MYLSQIVSGQEFGDECDMGTLSGKGEVIVSLSRLKEIISEGNYNIIKAQCFNPAMILVKYEKYDRELKMFR